MPICIQFNEEKVHSIYPEASMIPAMKIWSLPKNKRDNLKEYCDSGEYLASIKIDGFHYMLNKTENYTYLFSRSKGVNGMLSEKIDRVPHIAKAAEILPPDTLLVGEIYVPGGTSKDVTRIMGCLAPKAIQRQKEEGNLYYYLNDIIMYNGDSLMNWSFSERYEVLKDVYDTYFLNIPEIKCAENIDCDIYKTSMELIASGEEGMVLKKKTAKYEPDKRTAWSSIKIKPEVTFDVIVTGFEEPTKEYTGDHIESWEYWVMEKNDPSLGWLEAERWIGNHKAIRSTEYKTIPVTKAYYYDWKNAIQISAYNDSGDLVKIGTISSGLTDELREAFATHPEFYLNKVVEIRAMSVDSKEHTIRHGFLLRFREDKDTSECQFSEIFS